VLARADQQTIENLTGRYRLVRRLALGGMAEIFVARRDGSQPGPVVIKRILPQLAERPEYVEMFLCEARIARQLLHPHIVRTYEYGVDEGGYFISMELLEGMTLQRLLAGYHRRAAKLPRSAAIEIVRAICSALHFAHEQVDAEGKPLDIVHRDVSPQNVFITGQGEVKLLDFGIAKWTDRDFETKPNWLKGKLRYMSPEQFNGAAERRSDVYAVGLLLYELLLGRHAYAAETDDALCAQVITGRYPAPRAIAPDFPGTLAEILERALARDVADRYESCAALDGDLGLIARFLGASPRRDELAELVAEAAADARALEHAFSALGPGFGERADDASSLSIEIVLDEDGEDTVTSSTRPTC
jgi:serine/threonine protein kinase